MKIDLLLVLVSAAVLSGCAAYSPRTGEDIRELVRRTNEVVVDGDKGKLSLAESRRFLQQSQGQVQVMRIQGVGNKAEPHLDALDREYARLLQQSRPLRSRSAEELRGTLFALQSLAPVHSVRYQSGAVPSTDDTSTDTSTDNTTSKKDCDKDHDHGHDHGDRDCGCRDEHHH